MSERMQLEFPGGLRVTAHYDGFAIATDQAADAGGDGSAPEPFDLFLASLATCAGFYVMRFCQKRELPTDGLEVVQSWRRDEKTRRVEQVRIEVSLPEGFPDKYRDAVLRAAGQCSVKKALADPPEIEVALAQG